MTRLYQKYLEEVVPALQEKFGFRNRLAVPKVVKASVNVGINARVGDAGYLEAVEKDLARITGQKPVRIKAKKAISAFKVKENMVVGVKTTLRGRRMYDFLDKLINVSIPRIRDFRGLPPKSVDENGNLTIGFKEHNVFAEIKSDEVEKIHGLEVTVTTDAGDNKTGFELLRLLGFPFQK